MMIKELFFWRIETQNFSTPLMMRQGVEDDADMALFVGFREIR